MFAHSVTLSQSCLGVKSLTLPMIGSGHGPGGKGTTDRARLRTQVQSKIKTVRRPTDVNGEGMSVKCIERDSKRTELDDCKFVVVSEEKKVDGSSDFSARCFTNGARQT